MTPMLEQWSCEFHREFLRRTGITWADAGNTEQDIARYAGLSVDEAVSRYIEKYNLTDLADSSASWSS